MTLSIVQLIERADTSEAVGLLEKVLGKKLLAAVAEERRIVARDTYGSLLEFTSGDDQPVFVNGNDNAYLQFFQDALRKFGVEGPNDFKDDQTKKNFFDYVDKGWKTAPGNITVDQGTAQGAAQPGNVTVDQGTQTALPQQTGQPQVGQNNVNAGVPQQGPQQGQQNSNLARTDDGNQDDESLDGMNDDGDPSIETDEPLPGEGSDGNDPDFDDDDEEGGDFDDDDDEQNGFGNGDGDEEVVDPNGASSNDDDGNLDSDFDDEDAYSVDPSDFLPGNKRDGGDDGDEEDELDQNGDGMNDDTEEPDDEDLSGYGDDSEDSNGGGEDDDQDDDENGQQQPAFGNDDSDESDDDQDDDSDDDDDQDDDSDDSDQGDDSDDDDDDDDSEKKPFVKVREAVESDNLDDLLFVAEAMNIFKSKRNEIRKHPKLSSQQKQKHVASLQVGEKKFRRVQNGLTQIKMQRDAMLKQLRKERQHIKADPSKSREQKHSALKQLAGMARENRKHFKNTAGQLKAIHTGA